MKKNLQDSEQMEYRTFFSSVSLAVNGRVVLKIIFHGVDWIHLALNTVTSQALVHIYKRFSNVI